MQTRIAAVVVMAAVALAAVSLIHAREPAKPGRPADAEAIRKLETEAKEVILKHLQAMQAEDMDAMVATFHPRSPNVAPTRMMTAKLAQAYDLKYELLSLSYFGADKDYLAVRVRQKTTKVAGPGFRDNVVDVVHFLRKDGKRWRLWQATLLEIKFLHPPRGL
ncbi:MAG: hypothetical protein ACYS5V_12690 [Planctomycetota bacterium]|jgi:Cu/Ag efflux protein CusF